MLKTTAITVGLCTLAISVQAQDWRQWQRQNPTYTPGTPVNRSASQEIEISNVALSPMGVIDGYWLQGIVRNNTNRVAYSIWIFYDIYATPQNILLRTDQFCIARSVELLPGQSREFNCSVSLDMPIAVKLKRVEYKIK